MDCVEFEALLFHGLDRELASPDVERMQAHLFTCAKCRGLRSLVRGDGQQDVTGLPHDFVAGVVTSTSGRPCERAQLLLAVSEGDASDDDWLVARHLESCPDCAAVARALARLRLELPTLAEADPGEGFVRCVIAATFGRGVGLRGSQRPGSHGFVAQLIRRPRIALEGAYAIAMLVSILGLTAPSFFEVSARAAGDTWRSVADTARTVAAGASELNDDTLALAGRMAESASADVVELGAIVSSSARELAWSAWDGLITRNLEQVRLLWNEKVSGAVDSDTSNSDNR